MKTYLVIGADGQLGTDLLKTFPGAGLEGELSPFTRRELDITDREAVLETLHDVRPVAVLNTAAYNKVDAAEAEPGRAEAFRVNAEAVGHLAEACRQVGAKFVHFSTDYVFAGGEGTPRRETDPAEPLSQYGRSKLAGERLALASGKPYVIRVCGLYGVAGRRKDAPNFVERVLGWAREGRPLRIVADQVLAPSYTLDVAAKVWETVKRGKTGLYHLVNEGETSFHGFAQAILELSGLRTSLTAVTMAEYAAPAPRPPYSVLAMERLREQRLGGMPHWKDALARYLKERG